MSRSRRGTPVHGVVLLDKPKGMSSNHALQAVRRLFDARKAGHTGTLDPFATGMLPLCFGEATKTAGYMLSAEKAYRATMQLGSATDTGDTEGSVTSEMPVKAVDEDTILSAMDCFTGDIEQVPPMYSALKHQGRPLYRLAREGKTVERKPRRVTVHEIHLVAREAHSITFELRCSKGTYVRTLAEDIAHRLGTCAHLVALRRLWVEPFEEAEMVSLEQLESAAGTARLLQCLRPLDEGLRNWPVCELAPEAAQRFIHGNPVAASNVPLEGWIRVHSVAGQAIGIGEAGPGGLLKPRRVYHFEND